MLVGDGCMSVGSWVAYAAEGTSIEGSGRGKSALLGLGSAFFSPLIPRSRILLKFIVLRRLDRINPLTTTVDLKRIPWTK